MAGVAPSIVAAAAASASPSAVGINDGLLALGKVLTESPKKGAGAHVSPHGPVATPLLPPLGAEDIEVVLEASVSSVLYAYNDVLLRCVEPGGRRLIDPKRLSHEAELYMQVNGKPALAELLRPERRIHLYGASPYWSYLHLGEARAQERAARPQLSSAAFYTELEGEALHFIRFLRLKPSPQRFSV